MLQYAKKNRMFCVMFFQKGLNKFDDFIFMLQPLPLFIVWPQVFSTGFNSKFDDFILMLQHTTPLKL
jgi:hypothetical protein